MLKITSSVFLNGEKIPQKYTCDGEDINPPLLIEGAVDKVKSLALILDDPDAPMGTWNHWLIWNINPKIKEIGENEVPKGAAQGTNSSGRFEYQGPCPPSGNHRYYFKLFALDRMLDIPVGSKKEELLEAMKGHIIDEAELMGKYSRN